MIDATSETGTTVRRMMALSGLLLCLAGIAAWLRFYHLSEQGILAVDEGRYTLDAVCARAELGTYAGLFQGKLAELRGGANFSLADYLAQAHDRLLRRHPFAPKPGFACASAIAMKLTGNTISACSYTEAIFGVLTIIVLFAFVCDIYNTRAAVIATALMSFSVYAVYFARNAYPQSGVAALFLLALWCHYRWVAAQPPSDSPSDERRARSWARLIVCGAVLGVCFWFNYQIAGAAPALVLVHLVACTRLRRPRRIVQALIAGLAAMAFGFALVMLLAEGWTYPLIILFRGHGLVYPHATFLELLMPRLIGQSGVDWNWSGWVLFPYFIYVTDGPLYLAALALVIAAAFALAIPRGARSLAVFKRMLRHFAFVYCALPLVAIAFVFSFKTMQGARMFVTALPLLFAVTAIAVDSLLRTKSVAARAVLGICGACMVLTMFFYYPGRLNEVLSIRSAYPELMAYVRAQSPPSACAAWSAVLEAYGVADSIETGSVYAYERSRRPLPAVFVSDWQELYNRRAPSGALGLTPGATPINQFDHSFGRIFLAIEAFPSFGNSWDNIRWVNGIDLESSRRLLVFDSRDFLSTRSLAHQ